MSSTTQPDAFSLNNPATKIRRLNRAAFAAAALIPFLFSIPAGAGEAASSCADPCPEFGSIEILDPAGAALFPQGARMVKLADGFTWTEGPVWLPDEHALLFADMINNRICKWKDGEGVSTFLEKSGGVQGGDKVYNPGSNGMILNKDGQLLICQHSDRRIVRLDADGHTLHTVVDRFEGKRLNSPNDLVFDKAGNLFFTDPTYGLAKDSDSELGFCGVYRLSNDGKLTLLSKDFAKPNGIGISPDGKTLYASDSENGQFAVFSFALNEDGSVGPRKLFWNAMPFAEGNPGSTDGMTIDAGGNVWTCGPGGIYVLSPEDKLLAKLNTGEPTANCVFGGEDGHDLFIMANHTIVRLKTKTRGLNQ
ncbi:MAG: SMP-30/gluconolactonase/LRE family protein [Opitutales bacterium]|jgi:gluconolactonase